MGRINKKSNRPIVATANTAKYSKKDKNALIQMSEAPKIDEDSHWVQMVPAAFFTAFVIIITRMHVYYRDMDQFYWSGQGANAQIIDYFSYFKMVAIVICAIIAIIFLLFRAFTQTLYIQKSIYYYPMVLYSALVILSYVFSDYKDFALWGYNDRFEGTVTLLSYMVMLFYIINTVRTEKNVKAIVYSVAASSFILGLLGISQASGFDFFRTDFGKMVITPSKYWDQIDQTIFTFQNNEIYQTVYNINYVSFYLTLLIPLFGMLFIYFMTAGKESHVYKKMIWGLLFVLATFNLIGSKSSGGLMGIFVAVLVAIIILNTKIFKWWKPIIIFTIITLLIGGFTLQRWMPELKGAISSVLGKPTVALNEIPKLDYLDTDGYKIKFSVDGNEAVITVDPENPEVVKIVDNNGKEINLIPTEITYSYKMDDERFSACLLQAANDKNGEIYYIFSADMQNHQWPLRITNNGVLFLNGLGALVDLEKIPAVGWESNSSWGSGRGYIFSRSIPMLKETLILGHGADTYCIYFPHNDYVGKYNAGIDSNMIFDKPHNMYLGMSLDTGGLSFLTMLAFWGIYIVQSGGLYFRSKFKTFNEYVGAAIMFGVCGFLAAGLVNDSTVSTFPMFYGLLATGISINYINKRNLSNSEKG